MRALFWAHRWLGIVTCLLCAIWFISGLVMVYVPYPSWRDDERAAFLPPIDTARIAVMPGEALAKAGLKRAPTIFRLEMYGDEPVYRIVDFERHVSISAVDGREISKVGDLEAIRRLSAMTGHPLFYLGDVDIDQWTVTRRYSPHRPFHLFEADDGQGTQYYLSSRTGEIVQSTTESERAWNWLGSVPHWIYFTSLRSNSSFWRDVILWTSGPAAIGSALGIYIGILRLRLRNRYGGGKRISPYRGVMKWHHVTGLIGGLFLTAWLASGWLSVGPFGWLMSLPVMPDHLARYYTPDAPSFETSPDALLRAIGEGSKEVQFTWVGGTPLVVTNDGAQKRAYDALSGEALVLTQRQVIDAARRVFPDLQILSSQLLESYDTYWYQHRSERPLPAMRVEFDNPGRTWLTIDMLTGRVVGASDTADRWDRWLFHFVHQYDHPELLERPYLRQALIWALSLVGISISLTGMVVGVRSLRRA